MSDLFQNQAKDSEARKKRRAHLLKAAHALVGAKTTDSFDPVHHQLCAIDVVMVAGPPGSRMASRETTLKMKRATKRLGAAATVLPCPIFSVVSKI